MRYAQIRKMDVSNGEGVGIALFVQGCNFHCNNCFNQETWDFNGGHEWNDDIEDYFISLADKPYITRISILGGEPLDTKNVLSVMKLTKRLKEKYPEKKIWLYSGYTYDQIKYWTMNPLKYVDILVEGKYVDELKDYKLKYRGSSNQRVIEIKNGFYSAIYQS